MLKSHHIKSPFCKAKHALIAICMVVSTPIVAEDILDSYVAGDTLTVEMLNNIKSAVNSKKDPIDDEYIVTYLETFSASTVANSWENVPDFTVTLDPGTWDIGYDVLLALEYQNGVDLIVLGNVAIFDALDNLVGYTIGFVASPRMNSVSDNLAVSVSRNTRITVATRTLYKIKIRSSSAAEFGRVLVMGTSYSAALDNPDNFSVFWARKVNDLIQ